MAEPTISMPGLGPMGDDGEENPALLVARTDGTVASYPVG